VAVPTHRPLSPGGRFQLSLGREAFALLDWAAFCFSHGDVRLVASDTGLRWPLFSIINPQSSMHRVLLHAFSSASVRPLRASAFHRLTTEPSAL
jgi:hypothetical protein